jgi:hypothetical protein
MQEISLLSRVLERNDVTHPSKQRPTKLLYILTVNGIIVEGRLGKDLVTSYAPRQILDTESHCNHKHMYIEVNTLRLRVAYLKESLSCICSISFIKACCWEMIMCHCEINKRHIPFTNGVKLILNSPDAVQAFEQLPWFNVAEIWRKLVGLAPLV